MVNSLRRLFCFPRTLEVSGARRTTRRRVLAGECLELRALLAGAPSYSLVADVYASLTKEGSSPSELTQVGSTTYFVASTLAEGSQLWKTDGSAAGTVLVKDFSSGYYSYSRHGLTNFNGTLFFTSYDDVNGGELWKTDGTAAGTVIVKDIVPGSEGSNPEHLTVAGNNLFFVAGTDATGTELWKTDGTAAGTVLVKDIATGTDSALFPFGSDSEMVNVGGTLYFAADDGTTGVELWKSNGTSSGTTRVRDIEIGSDSSNPSFLTNVNGTLFFGAYDSTNQYALWKSNGTSSGTVVVRSALPSSYSIAYPTVVGSVLYFVYDDGERGREIWKSDGTSAGTVLVKDIATGYAGSDPRYLTNVGGTLYFSAEDDTRGIELWKSNGSAGGTVLVDDVYPGGASGNPRGLTNVNGTIFFSARQSADNYELFKTNGTAAGTSLVKEIAPGEEGSLRSFSENEFINGNGTLIFVASDGAAGRGLELWRSNGTVAGTTLLKDIQAGTGSADVDNITNLNGTILFTATNGTSGRNTIWKMNGSTPVLVKNLWPGSDVSLTDFHVVGNNAIFVGDSPEGKEIWKTDGTTAGTIMLKDINTEGSGSFPLHLTVVGTKVYFSADSSESGRELWVTDGTTAGTSLVKDIWPGIGGSQPQSLANVGGILYFMAETAASGYELWKSNGTASGTVMVRDIRSGSNSSRPYDLTNVNGVLYFSANDGTNGFELWKSNGTSSGTTLVKNIHPGSYGSTLDSLVNVNGVLYFYANDGSSGTELWKSNGTTAGTVRVKDIFPGTRGSSPDYLTNVNGTLYFSANDGTRGYELWKSDGTSAGTILVKDILPGAASSYPELSAVGGKLYLAADDGTGKQLWVSNGTTAGTLKTVNAAGQPLAIGPANITDIGGVPYFSAISPAHGRELFSLNLPREFSGTSGADKFVLAYTATTVTVTRAVGTGTPVRLGTFGLSRPVSVLGLTSADTVRIQGTSAGDSFSVASGNITVNNHGVLLQGAAVRTLAGVAGNDVYRFDGDAALGLWMLEESGVGTDTIDFSSTSAAVSVSLGSVATQVINGNLSLKLNSATAFENATGGSGNDTFVGSTRANVLTGNGGNDVFYPGLGSDSLIGGPGNDTYHFTTATAGLEADTVTELAGGGTDTLSFAGITTNVIASLALTTVQNVHANRTLKLNSNNSVESVLGGSGNDTLTGNTLDNVLVGNAGADRLIGGDGRDILIGGLGLDTLDGGAGDDILIAGRTTGDSNASSLNALRTQWISGNTYTVRVSNLRAGVGSPVVSLKAKTNVLNDAGEDDSLTGGTGTDWYFRALDDAITDLFAGEIIDVL